MKPIPNAMVPRPDPSALIAAGQAANKAAAANVFTDYRERKAENTITAHKADLKCFGEYLENVAGLKVSSFVETAEAWRGVTHGLVEGFKRWLLQQSYSIASLNRALSTVKVYANLAFKAGVLDVTEHALIRTVTGYSSHEARKVNEKREAADRPTRRERPGAKKAEPVRISDQQAKRFKSGEDHPQGRRDAVLMCLLLDHGLRCGEVALLEVSHVDLKAGELRFYRPKVDKLQTHRLTPDASEALKCYFESGAAPAVGKLLRGSRRSGKLTEAGMSTRAITGRVKTLGKQIGIAGLSAHDCRHYWATRAARSGTDPFALQEAGGWNSLAMPRHYVAAAKIANEGVRLD